MKAFTLLLAFFVCTHGAAADDVPDDDPEDAFFCLQTSVETLPETFLADGMAKAYGNVSLVELWPGPFTVPPQDTLEDGVDDKLQIFGICATIVAMLSSAVLIRELLLYCKVITQQLAPKHRHYMFALELFRLGVTTADSYMLLPGAWDLAKAVGWGPVLSGILDQFDNPGSVIGSLAAFMLVAFAAHKTQRRVLIVFVTFNAVLEITLAYCMITPQIQQAHSLLTAFITLRLLTGIAAGMGMVNQIMLTSVSSPKENAMLGTLVWACLAIGGAIGPSIPSITATFLPRTMRDNALVINAVPFLITACLQAVLGILLSFTLPSNLEQVSYIKELTAEEITQSDPPTEETDPYDTLDYGPDFVDDHNRMWLVVLGQVSGMISSMLVLYGLQALPVLLQRNVNWTILTVGPAVSTISIVSLVAMTMSNSIRLRFGTGMDKVIGLTGSIVGVVGALLTFNYYTPRPKHAFSGIQLIIGISMAAAFNGVTGGFMAGYGFAYADENKWYSKEMMSLGIGISTPLIGLGAGPLARGIAVGPGQNVFAALIVMLTVLLAGAFFIARFHLMRPKMASGIATKL